MPDTEMDAVRDGAGGSRVAAANAEYQRWGTGGDSRRPPGERAWACRQNDNGSWRITAYHRNEREADEARHDQAMAAAVGAALAAPSAAGGGEIQGEASFLLSRLDEFFQGSIDDDCTTEALNDWLGHVAPPISRLKGLLASPSQGSDAREAGREPGAYGIPGMPDKLSNSDRLRIFSAYYADRLPAVAAAELVTMADEWDEEVRAARSSVPTAPQGADLAGLSAAATQGEWFARPLLTDQGSPLEEMFISDERGNLATDLDATDARFIVALVNAYRSGALVPTTSAPPASADRETIARAAARRLIFGITDGPDVLWDPNQSVVVRAGRVESEMLGLLAHPGPVASISGESSPWSCDMVAVPADEEVEVGAGRMTFLAKLVPNGSLTLGGKPCDQWQATREGEHPPCWSDGCCWASNEDEDASLLPDRWRRVAPPPASRTEGERP